jgi:hypothetical protein
MPKSRKHIEFFLMRLSNKDLMKLMRAVKRVMKLRKLGKMKRTKRKNQLERDFLAAVSL